MPRLPPPGESPRPKPKPRPRRKPVPGGTPGGPGGPIPGGQASSRQWNAFLTAEAIQESGRNQYAVSPAGALGEWQVMPANLPGWAAQCGMPPVSPNYFLSNFHYQLVLVTCILGRYFNRYGPEGAAAMWYSGQPNPNATFGNPPVYQYVNDVLAIMGKLGPGAAVGPQPGQPGGTGYGGIGAIPSPGQDNWSDRVGQTGNRFREVANSMAHHTASINQILLAREEH